MRSAANDHDVVGRRPDLPLRSAPNVRDLLPRDGRDLPGVAPLETRCDESPHEVEPDSAGKLGIPCRELPEHHQRDDGPGVRIRERVGGRQGEFTSEQCHRQSGPRGGDLALDE